MSAPLDVPPATPSYSATPATSVTPDEPKSRSNSLPSERIDYRLGHESRDDRLSSRRDNAPTATTTSTPPAESASNAGPDSGSSSSASASANVSSTVRPRKKKAPRGADVEERAQYRAQRFQDDPLILEFSEFEATCRNCYTVVKLSAKSPYDHCHWARHRQRCVKNEPVQPRPVIRTNNKRKNKDADDDSIDYSVSHHSPQKRRRRRITALHTPSLTPDDDDDRVKEETPLPSIPPPPVYRATRRNLHYQQYDLGKEQADALDAFFARSRRKRMTELTADDLDVTKWSPARLKMPVLDIFMYSGPSFNGAEDAFPFEDE